MDLGQIVEAIKVITRARYAFATWVTCGIAVIGHITKVFVVPETAYLVISFFGVLGFVIWIVELTLMGWDSRKAKQTEEAKDDEVLCFLDTLGKHELHIFAKALARNVQTLSLGRLPIPLGMAHKGLLDPIERSPGDYVIPTFVWRRLQRQKTSIVERAKAANPGETYDASKAITEEI